MFRGGARSALVLRFSALRSLLNVPTSSCHITTLPTFWSFHSSPCACLQLALIRHHLFYRGISRPHARQVAVQLLCLPQGEMVSLNEHMSTTPPSSPTETVRMLREIATTWPSSGGSLLLQINADTSHYKNWWANDLVSTLLCLYLADARITQTSSFPLTPMSFHAFPHAIYRIATSLLTFLLSSALGRIPLPSRTYRR